MEVKTQLTMGEHRGDFYGSQNTAYEWGNIGMVFIHNLQVGEQGVIFMEVSLPVGEHRGDLHGSQNTTYRG